jgi:hypothetical protein
MPAVLSPTSPRAVRVHTVADLAGRAATDLVLVDGYTEPVMVYLAERLLPAPAPAARTPAVPTAATSR